MPTGYALLERIDAAIIFIPIRIGLLFVSDLDQNIIAGIATGIAWFVYAGFLEGRYGKTVGKHLMHLKVVSMIDRKLLRQGFIRSVPKLFWYAFLPVDTLLGLAMEGDPRQRFTDRVSLTSVITYEPELSKIKNRSQPVKKVEETADLK